MSTKPPPTPIAPSASRTCPNCGRGMALTIREGKLVCRFACKG